MRGTGQTLALVKALPGRKCAVIVHSDIMRKSLRLMIEDVRGRNVSLLVDIFVIRDRRDCDRLDGFRKPCLVDHAFWGNVPRHLSAEVEARIHGINTMLDFKPDSGAA